MVLTSQRSHTKNNEDGNFLERKPLEEGLINLRLLCPGSHVTNCSMLHSGSIRKMQIIKQKLMLKKKKVTSTYRHSTTFNSTCPESLSCISWEFTATNEEQNSRQIQGPFTLLV